MYFIYKDYNDLCLLYYKFSKAIIAFERKRCRPAFSKLLGDEADDIGWIQKLIIDKTNSFHKEVNRAIARIEWEIDRVNKFKEFYMNTNKVTQIQAMKRMQDYEYFALPKLRKELNERIKARDWYIGEWMVEKDYKGFGACPF